ncbi:hypothetical protein D3C72_2183380 [compost metagenome]
MTSKSSVPTRKEISEALSTLSMCRASWPLMPACIGIMAPESRGRASRNQLNEDMVRLRETRDWAGR